MATHAHSTTAPAVQPRLLPFVFRPVPPVNDPRSAVELLDEIRRTIEAQSGKALAAAESIASQPCSTKHLASDQALASTARKSERKSGVVPREDTLFLRSQENPHATADGLLPSPAPLPSLSTAFSRRRAIFGAVALAAAPVAVLPAAAADLRTEASPEASPSPEAAALSAEFDRVSTAYGEAGREADDACERIAYAEPPEALFWRTGDQLRLRYRRPVKRWEDDRRWYGERDLVEDLRAAPFRYMDGRRDDDGANRRDEIVEAWDRWQSSKRATEDACGYTVAEARLEAAHEVYESFIERLVDLRTVDPDIIVLKARVVFKCARSIEGLDRLVMAAHNADGVRQEGMAMSLVRDIISQLGAAHRDLTL